MTVAARDHILLHIIVLSWGFTAILGLLITVPPVEVVLIRTGLAAIGLWILLRLLGRKIKMADRRDLAVVLSVGVLIAAHWILFFLSARVSNASICLAGMATCSLWTSIIEPIYFRRRIKSFEVLLGAVAFLGICIIFNVEFDHIVGLTLAVFSALLSALFTVMNATVTKRNDHFVIMFYEMVVACGLCVVFLPAYTYFGSGTTPAMFPSIMDWFYLLILAGVCTVFAYSYSIKLMKRLSPFTVNLTVNLEPVYGIILALLIFGESEDMSSGFYLGTGLIMLSVLAYPVINRSLRRKALETDILR